MRLLILTVSLWALAYAKPEMYREKEDFQYSRSSSDEGSKHGYYGAQRGNMGGNYEKAHNMDGLAQHQMSTLVRQVDGELGDGANTRTGSVFTAGNSRGIFGSGHYDLSNLKGRNFDEGASFDNSQSQSSLLSSQSSGYSDNLYSSANNARYSASQLRSLGHNSAHQSSGLASQHASQFDTQQIGDYYSGSDNYEHGAQGASQYKYYSRSGNQARSEYDQSNSNLYDQSNYDANTRSRFVSRVPVRVYVRPGTRVTVPIAAQTYNAAQSSLVQDQNTVNTETELVSNSGQRINVVKPAEKPKHFESSYSYHKEWEKHDTQPAIVIPTENPFPKNSELYDDAQLSQNAEENYEGEIASKNAQSSSVNSAYSSNINSGISSRYSTNTKTAATNRLLHQSQTHGSSSSANSNSNSYTAGLHSSDASSNVDSLIDTANSRPKSYQSSYSYHKSWERRGDPYVIQPVGDASSSQTSQRLVAASADKNSYTSNQYGSRYSQLCQTYVNPCNLEDVQNIRRRRSYNIDQYQQQMFQPNQESVNGWERDPGQEIQNNWDELENLGQQPQRQWGNLEYLGQETQSNWNDLGQQSQNQLGNLEDLGQETQNHWDNLENLNQQLTNTGDINQHSQSQLNNLEDLGQTTQNKSDSIENFNQQSQGGLEDLTQQTQSQDNLENVGQNTQNQWGNLEDLGQQTQSQWDKLENLGQQTQSDWDKLEELRPQIRETDSQQTQNTWNGIEDQHISTVEEQKQNRNMEQQQNIGVGLDKTTNFYNTQQNYDFDNNFMYTEQNHNKWDHHSNRDAFYHVNTNPWDNIFQESIPNQSLNKPTTGNDAPQFWGIVDQIISESDKKNENIDNDKFLNPHTSRENWETNSNDRNVNNQFNNFNQSIDTEKSKEEKSLANESNKEMETSYIDDKIIKNGKSKSTEEESKTIETEDISTVHQVNPIDVGRGDIGPDEIPTLSIEPTEKSNNKNKSNDSNISFGLEKPYKTQNEIEALSLINENLNKGKPQQGPTIINGFEDKQINLSTNKPVVDDDGTLVYNPIYISPLNVDNKHNYEHNKDQVHENIEQQNLKHEVDFLGQEMSNNYDQSLVDFDQQQTSMNRDLQFFYQQEPNKFETGIRHVPKNENVQNQAAFEDQNLEPINENQIRNYNIGNLQSIPINQHQTGVQPPVRHDKPLSFTHSQQEFSDISTDFTHEQESENVQKHVSYDTQNEEFLNVEPLNVEQKISKHNIENVQHLPKNQDIIDIPIEPTEKPGFWKSVWGKTVNVKNKVASLFKS